MFKKKGTVVLLYVALVAITVSLLSSCAMFGGGKGGVNIEAENVPYEWVNKAISEVDELLLEQNFDRTVVGKQITVPITDPDGTNGSIIILFDEDGTLGLKSLMLSTPHPETTIYQYNASLYQLINKYMVPDVAIGEVVFDMITFYGTVSDDGKTFTPTNVKMNVTYN